MTTIISKEHPYIESSQVVESYGNQMQTWIDDYQDQLSHVAVLGSLGTGRGRADSDMDIQIIIKDEQRDLQLLSEISSQELLTRKKLSKTLDMPNLARHRASVMTQSEWSIYMRGFITSFLLPRVFGEYAHIHGEYRHGMELFPPTRELLQADLCVTLEHKNLGHERDGSPKRMRRNARDMHRYESGERYKDDPDMDQLVSDMFDNDFMEMKRLSQKHTERFVTEQGDSLLEDKRKRDSLLRTWEKTRWEILQSYEDVEYLHLRSQGNHKGFGFSPAQISNLARSCSHLIHGKELHEKTLTLQRACSSIESNPSTTTLTTLFETLNNWAPSVIEEINMRSHHVAQHQVT